MKQTNERAVIRLLHAPTGKYIDFNIAETAVPSVHFMNESAYQEREKLDKYLHDNGIDFDKKGTKKGTNETFSPAEIAPEHLTKIGRMNSKIIKLKIDSVASILDPVEGLPAGFENKRDLIEQCISGAEVIPAIMDFFSKHSGSTTALPEHCPRPIHILDRSGQPWESAITKALEKSNSSTG